MTTATAVAIPVNTGFVHGTAYLEVIPVRNGVRVQRTNTGRTLNPFWDVWLRRLLLTRSNAGQGLSVTLGDNSVFVSSSRIKPNSLAQIVRSIATVIVPIPNPPITRRNNSTRSCEALWWVNDDADVTQYLKELRLPKGSSVDGGESLIILRHSKKSPFRIGVICRMIELHVALACRP